MGLNIWTSTQESLYIANRSNSDARLKLYILVFWQYWTVTPKTELAYEGRRRVSHWTRDGYPFHTAKITRVIAGLGLGVCGSKKKITRV